MPCHAWTFFQNPVSPATRRRYGSLPCIANSEIGTFRRTPKTRKEVKVRAGFQAYTPRPLAGVVSQDGGPADSADTAICTDPARPDELFSTKPHTEAKDATDREAVGCQNTSSSALVVASELGRGKGEKANATSDGSEAAQRKTDKAKRLEFRLKELL